MDVIDTVLKYTKGTRERVAAMVDALTELDAQDVPGDVVECGVWSGGNIILSRLVSPKRICWLYDTFHGMTEPGQYDVKASGHPAPKGKNWDWVSVEEVRGNLELEHVLDDDYLRFVEGPVEQTLLVESNLPEWIALLRLDTDWYQSTKMELEILYPRLVPGGVLIVDDYGHWAGCRKATNDYFAEDALRLEWLDYTAVMMRKPYAAGSG